MRRLPLPLVFVFLGLVVYVPTAGHGIDTVDVAAVDVGAWAIATTGEPWVDHVEDHQLPDVFPVSHLFTVTHADNGNLVIARSVGTMLAGVPAYAVAQMVAPDSKDRLWSEPGGVTAAVIASVALGLLVASLSGLLRRRLVVVTGGALAVTTPFWSVAAHDLWPHTLTVLGIGGMCWAARRDRWWLVGVFGGLGLLGRLHLSLMVAVVGVGMALHRREPLVALKVAAGSLPFVALSSLLSHWLYGTWSPNGAYLAGDLAGYASTQSVGGMAQSIVGTFVAPSVGIFVWTPALALMIPAVLRSWRELPPWTKLMSIGGAAYLLVQLALNPFHGGSGFWGYRIPLEFVVASFPLVALSTPRLGEVARALMPVVLGLQLGVIGMGAGLGLFAGDDWGIWSTNPVAMTFAMGPGFVTFFVVAGVATAYCVRGLLRSTERIPDPPPVGSL